MKYVPKKEMPTRRQFVAVWQHDGQVWSGVYKMVNGNLLRYMPDDIDDWIDSNIGGLFFSGHNAIFMVLEED